MTLSMRHATWQQLSHEPRAAINAIVAIRRMHLIAKIKTHSHTHTQEPEAKNKQQNTEKQKRASTTKYGSREAAETAEPTPKAKARELHKVGSRTFPHHIK